MTSKSLELPPRTMGDIRLLIDSQLCHKPQKAPAGTSFAGKVAILTGGTQGLGLHAAKHFLDLGIARLIIAVRSPDKGEAVAVEFRTQYPKAQVEVWELEMSSYTSIQAFVRRVETTLPRVDYTVLNAGCFGWKFVQNKTTGHDETIQVNYLSTFLLTILLMPVLRAQAQAEKSHGPTRLTIVGSGVAIMAKMPNRNKRPLLASFDDLTAHPFDAPERYYSSKLLGQLLFARLIPYLPNPDEVIVNIVDPGLCKGSALHRTVTGVPGKIFGVLKEVVGRTLDDGAWTYIDAVAVKGKESHGCFLMDWEIRPFAKLVYEPEGEAVMDALWEETMAEFEFAGVREIVDGLRK